MESGTVTDLELLGRLSASIRRETELLDELNSLKKIIEARCTPPVVTVSAPALEKVGGKRDFQAWLQILHLNDGHEFIHRKTQTPLILEWVQVRNQKQKLGILKNADLNIRASSLSAVIKEVSEACGVSTGNGWSKQVMAKHGDGKFYMIEDEIWGIAWNNEYKIWIQKTSPLPLLIKTEATNKNQEQIESLRKSLKKLEAEYDRLDGSNEKRVAEIEARMKWHEDTLASLK